MIRRESGKEGKIDPSDSGSDSDHTHRLDGNVAVLIARWGSSAVSDVETKNKLCPRSQ